jgi:ankyrin repeat protein
LSLYDTAKSLFERAVDSEIPEMIEVMLAYGANIDSKDVYGNSMLHRAVRAGNPDIVNQLLE